MTDVCNMCVQLVTTGPRRLAVPVLDVVPFGVLVCGGAIQVRAPPSGQRTYFVHVWWDKSNAGQSKVNFLVLEPEVRYQHQPSQASKIRMQEYCYDSGRRAPLAAEYTMDINHITMSGAPATLFHSINPSLRKTPTYTSQMHQSDAPATFFTHIRQSLPLSQSDHSEPGSSQSKWFRMSDTSSAS